ncbi:MAG: hypothetical protein GY940_22220, partial [bacterium]|nr:hypothetical protein [bacterium]
MKIRGFRIELGEIENRLLKHENINEAVVVVKSREAEDKYLCAYVVPREEFEASELKGYLSKMLPDYMVPSFFVSLDRFPLTSSGKIDTKALPEPGIVTDETHTVPKGAVEKRLAVIWSELLAIELKNIGRDAGFFELGGHSLTATVMTVRIQKELEADVPLREVFRTPTIEGLARYITTHALNDTYAEIKPVEKQDYYPLSPAQKRLYILQQLELKSTAYNMPYLLPLQEGIKKESLEKTFKQLIRRHESLRTSFQLVEEQPVQVVHDHVEFEIELFGRGVPPWSPLNGNHSPINGKHSPINGKHSPINGKHSPINGKHSGTHGG